jgi:hypothetical protein
MKVWRSQLASRLSKYSKEYEVAQLSVHDVTRMISKAGWLRSCFVLVMQVAIKQYSHSINLASSGNPQVMHVKPVLHKNLELA